MIPGMRDKKKYKNGDFIRLNRSPHQRLLSADPRLDH